jgi:hypothetical protein
MIPLQILISQKRLAPESAENYYLFRLRRICEMAHKTSGILLTYEDLVSKSALPLVQNHLGLKFPFAETFAPLRFDDDNIKTGKILTSPQELEVDIPKDVLNRCTVGYNRYLDFMERRTSLIRFVASTVLV